MSGAQAKAAVIAGCIGVVAEVLCITVTQKLQYAFLNWSIHACFSDHLPSNPEVHLGIQFLDPSIYLYLSPPRYSVAIQELYVYLSERNQKPQRLESLRGRQIFCWSALVTNSHDFPWPMLFSCTFTSRFCLLFVSCVKVHFLLLSSIHLSTHSSCIPVNLSPQQTRHNWRSNRHWWWFDSDVICGVSNETYIK